jgi:DNA-binding IclR family transcriptional regulator
MASDGFSSGLGLLDVERQLSIPKSTAYRLLATLESEGFARRDQTTGLYRLGSKVMELGGAFLAGLNVRSEAEEFLKRLVDETGETANLGVPDKTQVMIVDKIDSPHSLRMSSRIGEPMPMYCTALGKAILAHMTDREFAQVTRLGLPKRTANTITSIEDLQDELRRVREQGFAVDDIEHEAGERCVGSPIFDHNGKVVAGVSVSGPATRITPDNFRKLGVLVMSATREISRRLGHVP